MLAAARRLTLSVVHHLEAVGHVVQRVGIEADVLAAAARVVAAGYLHTPESDHDGAWAALEY